MTFEKELLNLINKYSLESESNTPDFILVQYVMDALVAWNRAIRAREQWYGHDEEYVGPTQHAQRSATHLLENEEGWDGIK